jgi:hypothetical protein
MDSYPLGFEEDDRLRSAFIRDLTLQQLDLSATSSASGPTESALIPKTLIRYWHDPCDVPEDVRACLNSWDRLNEEGFEFRRIGSPRSSRRLAQVISPPPWPRTRAS